MKTKRARRELGHGFVLTWEGDRSKRIHIEIEDSEVLHVIVVSGYRRMSAKETNERVLTEDAGDLWELIHAYQEEALDKARQQERNARSYRKLASIIGALSKTPEER